MDYSQLNPQQLEAVTTTEGPLLVLAGAGTGKTRVITYRIACMLERGIAPAHVLAVTFTNKAAREMRERIARLVTPAAAADLTVGTFHAFCARILRRSIDRLGFDRNFAIAPYGFQVGLVQSILAEAGVREVSSSPRAWLAGISRFKAGFRSPEEAAESATTPGEEELARVYALYERRLHGMNLLDFDDLLVLTLRLWRERPEVLAFHRDRFRYLLVDEYQDTNRVQFYLLETLAGEAANICAVGDDDQSIYGWRGASVENILQFETAFPGARVIRLEQNYRSTAAILDLANHVIAANPRRHAKRLRAVRGPGEKTLVVRAETPEREAEFVAEFLRDKRGEGAYRWSDFAVLYRSNQQSRVLEQVFRRQRLPYRIVGGRSFFERKEVLDAVAFVQAGLNPKDELSLLQILNVPPRGLGDKAVEHLKQVRHITGAALHAALTSPMFLERLSKPAAAAAQTLARALAEFHESAKQPGNAADKVRRLFQAVGYLDGMGRMYKPRENAISRRDNVLEFLDSLADFEASHPGENALFGFLEQFALRDDRDRVDGAAGDAVTLSTVHAAKGLEYPVVVVVGVEQDLFPHRESRKERGVDEERRLFYVALTRARDELVLTHARTRRVRGSLMRRRPSEFLEQLPEALVAFVTPAEAIRPATPEQVEEYLAQLRAQFQRE